MVIFITATDIKQIKRIFITTKSSYFYSHTLWKKDDDVESKEEQDAIIGAKSSAKIPRYKVSGTSLGEATVLLREAKNRIQQKI